jgi:hypothetical protein
MGDLDAVLLQGGPDGGRPLGGTWGIAMDAQRVHRDLSFPTFAPDRDPLERQANGLGANLLV